MTAICDMTPEERAVAAERMSAAIVAGLKPFADMVRGFQDLAAKSAPVTTNLKTWMEEFGGAPGWMTWDEAQALAKPASAEGIRRPVNIPRDEPVADTPAAILSTAPKTGPPSQKRRSRRESGVSKNSIRRLTKNQGASTKPPSKTQVRQSLYSGRTLRGFIRRTEAFDLAGNSLGTFRTRSEAVGAVLASRTEATP